MKWLLILLISVFLILQYKLWAERSSVAETVQLKQEIAQQKKQNQQLLERNKTLIAEVNDLKHGHQAIEERARSELGMIKKGEQFYQIVNGDNAS